MKQKRKMPEKAVQALVIAWIVFLVLFTILAFALSMVIYSGSM